MKRPRQSAKTHTGPAAPKHHHGNDTSYAGQSQPSTEQIEEWLAEGGAEATDGCWVEPDGTCEHGCKSWLIVMGLI